MCFLWKCFHLKFYDIDEWYHFTMFFKLLVFVNMFIFCRHVKASTTTEFNVLREDAGYYILAVDPNLDYFVNGEFIVEKKQQKTKYKIIDTNNANDTILVNSAKGDFTLKGCEKTPCFGKALFYQEFAKKNEKKLKRKSIFFGAGKAMSNEITVDKLKVDSYGGISITSDIIIVDFDLSFLRVALGVNSNILHTSFPFLTAPYVEDYGNQMIDLISVSLSPTLYFFPVNHISIFASPLFNYSLIPYKFEEDGHSQKFSGGLSIGTCFGVISYFDDLFVSLRLQSSVTKVKSEYSFKGEDNKVNAEETTFNIQASSMLVTVGTSF